MKTPIQHTQTIPSTKTSMSRLFLRRSLALIALVFSCTALWPAARADCVQGCDSTGNTFLGEDALFNGGGYENTAIGYLALYHNTTGSDNTAVGIDALYNNTTGSQNTAIGDYSLSLNTTGDHNIAISAMGDNQTGSNNTAIGFVALDSNTTGGSNTANGYQALFSNNGDNNTATGASALYGNTTGVNNMANGVNALKGNTIGNSNTANGTSALLSNTTGNSNTAVGISALGFNTTGGSNIGLGQSAGLNLTTGSNNIDIGNAGVAGDSGKIRIGTVTHTNTYIAGIYGVTATRGVAVFVDSTGHLGTSTSSARFKDAIKPMDKASEAILALQPVTFRYNHELDPDGVPQFGLVAEQVEKVNPDLVARDDQGKPYTVRYEAVNAMLLNEFLKEHRKVEEQAQINQRQETTIDQQQKQIQTLAATLKEQASQIQKVSAQVAASKLAPPLVVSNQ